MTTIKEIECQHIEHRVEGMSESFVFKPSTYATYGAARKAMNDLISVTGITGLSQTEKEIAARWSLITDQTLLDNLLKPDEQSRIDAFHKSHVETLSSNSSKETSDNYYSNVSNEIIYDGTLHSEILWVNVVARANISGDIFSIRLYDVGNSKVVAEKTGLTNTNTEIIDLGEILYHPTTKTILELQIKRDSGNDVIISKDLEIKFI